MSAAEDPGWNSVADVQAAIKAIEEHGSDAWVAKNDPKSPQFTRRKAAFIVVKYAKSLESEVAELRRRVEKARDLFDQLGHIPLPDAYKEAAIIFLKVQELLFQATRPDPGGEGGKS